MTIRRRLHRLLLSIREVRLLLRTGNRWSLRVARLVVGLALTWCHQRSRRGLRG